MYLILGNEKYLIEQKIKEIQKQYPSYLFKNLYYESSNDMEIINQTICNNSLFEEAKIIVINNLPFLEKSIAKKDVFAIEQFIQNIVDNQQNILIFTNQNIDKASQLNKNIFTETLIKQMNSQIFELQKPSQQELINFAIKYVKDNQGDIDYLSAKTLINKINPDLTTIINELNKLMLYNKNITQESIDKLTIETNFDDPFNFVNSFETNNFEIIWHRYLEKEKNSVPISVLISQMSQLFTLCNQIYGYIAIGKNLEQLSSDLKINLFRLKKVNLTLKKLGINKIKHLIMALALLDEEIKSGLVDEKIGFERLLIKYFI
ncbi:DNA polymerase III subunit delta [Mycoplasmopsis iners]|uniref:DNA polymerase III subunit delta n=1 Tax=Mycoplasmopsis iners TaxID=76630 RepID=UPI0004965298|nr:DNA polymerase III subunit delta [Mycoplasmopsis iners]